MERLTKRENSGITYNNSLGFTCSCYCDNCSKGTGDCDRLKAMVNLLAKFEDLKEQGLLMRLTCKVGTEVFCFFSGDSHYTKCQIKKIEICPSIFGNICYFAEPVGQRGRYYRYFDYEFGKTVFLTREEAENKLKELRN